MTAETRLQAIRRHARAALDAGLPMRAYADRVVDLYHARTALHDRTIPFQAGTTAEAYEACARANAQTVERMLMTGTVRAAIDLEESLVLALPPAQRDAALRDLAARYGLLAASVPVASAPAQQTNVADLMRETGDLLATLSPAFADGALDAHDATVAARAMPDVLDLQARLATLAQALDAVLRPQRAPLRIAK